jgi:hypothetical protein
METLRAPKQEIAFYDVECSRHTCAALMHCTKGGLIPVDEYQPMSSVETSAYWMMRCPHCDCTTVVNFEKMAVRSDIT